MGGARSRQQRNENAYILAQKPEGKILLGKPRRRREENLKWILKK
jgi:hypothetical protein